MYTQYIAELTNTWTSFVITVIAVYCAVASAPVLRSTAEGRLTLITYAILGACGLGSVAFHATLTFPGQAADELTMLYSAAATVVGLAIARRPGTSLAALSTAATGLCVVVSFVYVWARSFELFFVTYASMVVSIAVLGWQLTSATGARFQRCRALYRASVVCYIGGFLFLWIPTEVLACSSVVAFNGHGIFHITSALGTTCMIALVGIVTAPTKLTTRYTGTYPLLPIVVQTKVK